MESSVNFDRVAEYYDATRSFPAGVAPQVMAYVADTAGLSNDSHLLEIGIGTGRIAVPLAPHVGSITGFDISAKMMSKLQAKATGKTPIRLLMADAHMMPFKDACFDHAYLTHVLHLVPDPVQVLREAQRVTKQGGTFIHMRNTYSSTNDAQMQKVVDIWNDTTKDTRGPKRWNRIDDTFDEAGMTLLAEYDYRYTYTSRLRDFIERIEKRLWSSTWLMDDATWQAGVDAVNVVIDAEFDGDRDFESPAEGIFKIFAYKSA